MPPTKRLGQVEFVAMAAMLFATIAFSIDAMLPALPQIAEDLTPESPNQAQLIITSFVFGMGVGTLVTGPLSDAFGRRNVLLIGSALYILGSALAWQAQSLEGMLAARVLQGVGAAGPRVVTLAVIRDLYSGRQMARIMSFVILVFSLIPAFAPTLGAAIVWFSDWRGIFVAFMIFAIFSGLWFFSRQAETLNTSDRRPFRAGVLAAGMREIVTHPVVALAIAAQSLCFGMLFATLSSTQQIFDTTFGEGRHFHLWFGVIAIIAASASIVNARLVERLGMRYLVTTMLGVQVIFSSFTAALFWSGLLTEGLAFWLYFVWTAGIFFQAGITLGNLNAIAMEPMGHIAGLTASVVGSVATVIAVMLAAPIGLMFDGTPRPLMTATLMLAIGALLLMLKLRAIEQRQPA